MTNTKNKDMGYTQPSSGLPFREIGSSPAKQKEHFLEKEQTGPVAEEKGPELATPPRTILSRRKRNNPQKIESRLGSLHTTPRPIQEYGG